MAAAAAAGVERPTLLLLSHNEMMFNILSANISYNSFIQSNEAECAEFFSHYSRRYEPPGVADLSRTVLC